MILATSLLIFITVQRLGEVWLAGRNTRALKAKGAVESGGGHYGLMVALHAAWVICLWAFGWDRPVFLWWLALFAAGQALRIWAIMTLGPRWTTRIIVQPQAPLVVTGPYRWIGHPNYVAVVVEIAALPMALGLPWVALIFTALNAAMLRMRIKAENQALGLA